MKHSLVRQYLSRTFKKSKVFAERKDRYKSVSPCRIRLSVPTELIVLDDKPLDNMGQCFARHGTEVLKKFYIQVFANHGAVKFSWKCVNLFATVSKEEKEAVDLREEKLHKLLVPTAQKILKWYQEHKNKLNLNKGVDVSDKGLQFLIKIFTDERKIRDVVSSKDGDSNINKKNLTKKDKQSKGKTEHQKMQIYQRKFPPHINNL